MSYQGSNRGGRGGGGRGGGGRGGGRGALSFQTARRELEAYNNQRRRSPSPPPRRRSRSRSRSRESSSHRHHVSHRSRTRSRSPHVIRPNPLETRLAGLETVVPSLIGRVQTLETQNGELRDTAVQCQGQLEHMLAQQRAEEQDRKTGMTMMVNVIQDLSTQNSTLRMENTTIRNDIKHVGVILCTVLEFAKAVEVRHRLSEHRRLRLEAAVRHGKDIQDPVVYKAFAERCLDELRDLHDRVRENKTEVMGVVANEMHVRYGIDVTDAYSGRLITHLFPMQRASHPQPMYPPAPLPPPLPPAPLPASRRRHAPVAAASSPPGATRSSSYPYPPPPPPPPATVSIDDNDDDRIPHLSPQPFAAPPASLSVPTSSAAASSSSSSSPSSYHPSGPTSHQPGAYIPSSPSYSPSPRR